MFKVLTGDIDHKVLESANQGVYSEFSFRALKSDLRQRYFDAIQGSRPKQWRVKTELREMTQIFRFLGPNGYFNRQNQ